MSEKPHRLKDSLIAWWNLHDIPFSSALWVKREEWDALHTRVRELEAVLAASKEALSFAMAAQKLLALAERERCVRAIDNNCFTLAEVGVCERIRRAIENPDA